MSLSEADPSVRHAALITQVVVDNELLSWSIDRTSRLVLCCAIRATISRSVEINQGFLAFRAIGPREPRAIVSAIRSVRPSFLSSFSSFSIVVIGLAITRRS